MAGVKDAKHAVAIKGLELPSPSAKASLCWSHPPPQPASKHREDLAIYAVCIYIYTVYIYIYIV